MKKTPIRRAASGLRIATLLMVTGLVGCDNVEWGGIDVAVVPPPPTGAAAEAELEAADRLPEGPILYHVRRDSTGATVTPVGEIGDDGLQRIDIGDDPAVFGDRFISAFLRQGAELTLFRQGRRAGTLIVDSASVPTGGVCRRLPRASGRVELSGSVGGAGEFLAMARTQAPEGRMPSDSMTPQRRMLNLGDIMAEQALRRRGAQLPNWNAARVQIQPFPVADSRDLGFTATYLVDDELQVGNDSLGYSLFLVAVPAESGYDTVFVQHTSYPESGKRAPRAIDFLDWDRDGQAELLLQVYGTRNAWFEAIDKDDDGWRRTLEDRCDTGAATAVAADSAAADTVGVPARPRPGQGASQTDPTGQSDQGQPDAPRQPSTQAAIPVPQFDRARLDSLLGADPLIRLALPRRPAADTAARDTGGGPRP